MYNLMTCEGWLGEAGLFTGCSIAWFGAAFLFFIIAFTRKGCEMAGMEFNSLGAYAVGYIAYILLVTLTGGAKWGLLAGIIGMIAGGLLLGMFFGGGESGYY